MALPIFSYSLSTYTVSLLSITEDHAQRRLLIVKKGPRYKVWNNVLEDIFQLNPF